MWIIFILSALVIALFAMIMFWAGNRIYLAMKRDRQKFNNDNKGEK